MDTERTDGNVNRKLSPARSEASTALGRGVARGPPRGRHDRLRRLPTVGHQGIVSTQLGFC